MKWLGVFLTGMAAGLAVALLWVAAKPEAPLTSGLSGNWTEASSQFDARVRDRFGAGTPIPDLINGLKSEGFEPMWLEAEGEYGAERKDGGVVCNSAARIYWIVGKNDTLSSIRGVYQEGGCL
ncbi:hypothetical protein NIBR502774_14255 (plasmid) [Rhizobium sp. NIBRBAC000502774]|nr:hypothetical protein NIBR502774_14255 [Rhizobium sp. NIBRBAC000502774]